MDFTAEPVGSPQPDPLSSIPAPLRGRPQWVVWKREERDGRPTKMPYQARHPGRRAKVDDPRTFATFEQAKLAARLNADVAGVGYVFTADDPFVGIDIDRCLTSDARVEPWAREYVRALGTTYGEVSPSGLGIKFVALGALPGDGKGRRRNGYGPAKDGAIEAYCQGRFFALTGDVWDAERPIVALPDVIESIYVEISQKPPDATVADVREALSGSPPEEGTRKPPRRGKAAGGGRPDKIARAVAYLGTIEGAISGQRGHDKTFRAACKLVEFGLDEDEVFRVLKEHYNPKCDPEWSDLELRHKASDAVRENAEKAGAKLGEGRDPRPQAGPSVNGSGAHVGGDDQVAGKARPGVFSNFTQAGAEGERPVRVARRMVELEEQLREIAGGWPKRVGVDNTLFIESKAHEPVYLDSTARLFTWIDHKAQVDWTKGVGRFIPQERFYENLRMRVEHFDAIEAMPHYPALPGIYYMHRPVARAGGGALERFLDFFRPATQEDRQLMKAFVLTCFWGGAPGSRPAFLVTGRDDDAEGGRGTGKTKLNDFVGELAGGAVDVSPTDAVADVKTRLLSDEARQTRFARLDNVKMLKFSWADLEGLITSPTISGRMLYRGEGRRPNTLVWGITLNGASLSRDMAQRVIPIRVTRPDRIPTWEGDVRSFIDRHRWDVIADVREILEAPGVDITPATRWAAWEAGVLSRVGLVNLCQEIIVARQAAVDDDTEERDVIADFIRDELMRNGWSPETEAVFMPSLLIAKWIGEATNQKALPTNRASSHLATLGIPELQKSRRGKPGWVWRGKECPPGTPARIFKDKSKDGEDWQRF